VIEQKTAELGRYLIGGPGRLDLSKPSTVLRGIDNREVRKRILSLTQQEARRFGIGKSTLHYLRKNAENGHTSRVYERTLSKLEMVDIGQQRVYDR
jgi:hypothetical protein